MNIVGIDIGRVILLFQPEEIRPEHGAQQKSVIRAIADRYGFTLSGEQITAAIMKGEDAPGMILKDGLLSRETGSAVTVSELAIYSDGVSVTASSTMDADFFLADVFGYLVDQFGYRPFRRTPVKLYNSQVVVKFDHDFRHLLDALKGPSVAIQSAASLLMGRENLPLPDLTRIAFAWDTRTLALPIGSGEFVLERRAGVAFNEGFYFSRAPLTTEAHLGVLAAFEESLSSL